MQSALHKLGIAQLYSHQAAALDLVRAGHDTVVVTPTASGKSLTYVLPLLDLLTESPDASALLLFPLKALEQDQAAKLKLWQQELSGELDFSLRFSTATLRHPCGRRSRRNHRIS
ncbi:MAG: DEAD/DEAH box helicase [bacterium]|nr:DEAD/DEAH box helicase [bacterium]